MSRPPSPRPSSQGREFPEMKMCALTPLNRGKTSNVQHRTPNTEHRSERRCALPFDVRRWTFDVGWSSGFVGRGNKSLSSGVSFVLCAVADILRCASLRIGEPSAMGTSESAKQFTLPMNPPLERDRSPVAAAPTACSCRNPSQVADCIRTRCAPGRRALQTPAGSGAQGAHKVRAILSWGRRLG